MTTTPPPDDHAPDRIPVTLLQRRGIEAEVLVPFIRRLERELGPERAHDLARQTIAEIAMEQGRAVAEALGREDLEGFGDVRDSWGGAGGDLTIDALRHDAEHLDFNVMRCRFAELYERLGARDLGFVLSCGRDFTLSEGYSPRLHLVRTQTIMQGAAYCDFRYTYAADESGGAEMTSGADDQHTEETPATDGSEAQPSSEPRRSHIRRGTGQGFGIGDDANKDAKDVFADRVRQAAAAARAAAERGRPGAEHAAREAKERAERAASAARPHIEHAAQGAANFAREHQDELKSAALRAARIAARLGVPPHVREAFEAELHRDDPKPSDPPSPDETDAADTTERPDR